MAWLSQAVIAEPTLRGYRQSANAPSTHTAISGPGLLDPGHREGLEVAVTIRNVQPQWPTQWPKEAVTVA